MLVFGLMVSLLFVFVAGEQSNPNFTVVTIRDGLPTYSANSRHDYDRLVSVVQAGLVKNTQLQKKLDKVLLEGKEFDDLEWVYSGEKDSYSMVCLVANWSDSDIECIVYFRMRSGGTLTGRNISPEVIPSGTIMLFAYNAYQINTYWSPGFYRLDFTFEGRGGGPGKWVYHHRP